MLIGDMPAVKYELNYNMPFPIDYEIWTAGRSPTYRCEMRTVHRPTWN